MVCSCCINVNAEECDSSRRRQQNERPLGPGWYHVETLCKYITCEALVRGEETTIVGIS